MKSDPTKVGLVIILFQLFLLVFLPVLTTENTSSSVIPYKEVSELFAYAEI